MVQQWTRWVKACPTPMTLELSNEMREAVSSSIDDETLKLIDSSRQNFLERISLRVMLLPSGSELPIPLRTPPGAMAYGKLLYGGVTRYRMIGSASRSKRRAGERSMVHDASVASWLQYGGPERNYEAIDMGPCALVELILTPKGLSLPLLSQDMEDTMALCKVGWNSIDMFDFVKEATSNETATNVTRNGLGGGYSENEHDIDYNTFHSTFTSTVGGLRTQIDSIVRRVLDGRVIRPVSDSGTADGSSHVERSKEAKALAELGLQPVRGLLLYGPPGCGKVRPCCHL